MKKNILLLVLSLFIAGTVFAQKPVSWTFSLDDKGNGEVELAAVASIARGWHLYDIEIPKGGPNPTELTIDELKGATKVGTFKVVNSKLIKNFDEVFSMEIGYYEGEAIFIQRFKVTDKAAFSLKGDIRSQACNDQDCTPPLPIDFSFSSKDLSANLVVEGKRATTTSALPASAQSIEIPKTIVAIPLVESQSTVTTTGKTNIESDLWAPVIDELGMYENAKSKSDMTLFWIFIAGMGGGFLALLTPCVWPMIPMTVSFFLKRNKKNRGKAIREAMTYGLGIILIYVSLGLIITAIFGASALNELATSAVFNIIFFALLVFFAISFFGAFEITLPSSWTTKMDSKADTSTGVISIFFMAFTLALVSFSCTGPVIGWLLVEASSTGAIVAPAIGMLGFAVALAIPFTLFAIFPSMLEKAPKSGGWLNSVKVTLGFLELALAFKFLSVADLAYGWKILDREVFLALWIIIFVLLGIYLLGKLKMSHDSDVKHISVPRLFFAIASLSFAVYMLPGLWGAPLKAISAFAPPLYTQDFNLYKGEVHAQFVDYDQGMEYAKRNNKPVLLDFTGYGCPNCRKMEASVWTNPGVKQIIDEEYVLITLIVDDKTKLPAVIEVTEGGSTSKLKTIGDKWSYLQRLKFGVNSQPYYITLNHEGKPIGPSYAYDEDIKKYMAFLNTGLENFKKQKEQQNQQ